MTVDHDSSTCLVDVDCDSNVVAEAKSIPPFVGKPAEDVFCGNWWTCVTARLLALGREPKRLAGATRQGASG